MARSVVGLFPDRTTAEQAITGLKAGGFDPRTIGLVMRDLSEARELDADQDVNSTAGAVTGGVLGGAAGVLAVPGVGPFITGGVLASLVGGTAGWLIGGLVGMGVPREEAEYCQGRVEQGGVLVTVDAHRREAKAWQMLLRDGAEDERIRHSAPLSSQSAAVNRPATQPHRSARKPLETSSGRVTSMDTRGNDQQYPPPQSGIAPGTVADAENDTDTQTPIGGVQPSAVSRQPSQARMEDMDNEPLARPAAPGTGPTPYSDTVTSSAAGEGADYNVGAPQPPDRHPVTDEDIIADARGAHRETDPDLDVAEEQPADQRGLA